ncbi:Maintenance of telomere capping protein 1 [Pleurostoma richardsiae]|uniref:Maintenance of telomere capping protein 1 n=1 Tax=Pleurostoma richardsiae TaxID=41990 RepID=A0AA38VJM0_9PEZI|nr:Maintenance of telomere capping protein 1 [Pleurostoma richardsiae]
MTSKRNKAAPTDDELGELFEGLGEDAAPKKSSKTKSAASGKPAPSDDDILAELENQLGDTQPSRPHTPRIKEIAKGEHIKRSATPTERSSEDKPASAAAVRKSVESARSFHASFTPSATSSDLQESEKRGTVEQIQEEAGGGWWGGILGKASAAATAAIKQAEATYKEVQQREEAKKWADQVRGLGSNVAALRVYGDEIRHRALPTFTDILHTLAPPISSHERLLIHITHDLVGYPSLDPLVHGVFSRVMAQVEGGDLLVIQRGHESSVRSPTSDKRGFFLGGQSNAGWRDGPWWRDVGSPRDLGPIKGLTEGTKLCRASAEAYSTEYFAASGGIEAARQRAVEPVSESNPVRSSDLFLSVQAISIDEDKSLFAGSASTEKEKETSDVLEEEDRDELVCFAVYILDPVHEIRYSAVSQAVPARWIRWLDAASPPTPASGDEGGIPNNAEAVPEEIREIVESGGVDPREWVAEWVEEALSLSVGVVAQRYVARRMGVGAGGIGKGKRRMEEVVQEGGGEAARAGVI